MSRAVGPGEDTVIRGPRAQERRARPLKGAMQMTDTVVHVDDIDREVLETARQQRMRGLLLAAVVLLAMLGVVNGWYLTMAHVDYQLMPDSSIQKVCGALASKGCAVTTGRFGDVLGLPVSLIGLAGASATAVAAAVARRRRSRSRDPWRDTALLLAATSVLVSALMATLSSLEGSFCPFCVAWYGLNSSMGACAFGAWRVGRQGSARALLRSPVGPAGVTTVAVFATTLVLGYGGYEVRRDMILDEQVRVVTEEVIEKSAPKVLDLEGLPAIGPEDAPLVVVEVATLEMATEII